MRKNYIVNIIFIGLFTSAIGFISCKNDSVKDAHAGHTKEMAIDSSISSLAKPANAQVISTIPTVSPESGTRIFSAEIKGQITYDTRSQTSISSRVAGRIEKLYIKYNYQPVKQGQLIMEIYSPDLAAAQRELLFIARSGDDDNMLSKAKQRLSLLGMQPNQINEILKTGNILYRVPVYSNATGYILEKSATAVSNAPVTTSNPASSTDGMDNMSAATNSSSAVAPSIQTTPVLIREGQYVSAGQSLFTIYRAENVVAEFALKPEMASQVKRGKKMIFNTSTDKEKVYTGTIGLIQPKFRSGENFTLARVYITDKDLLPGQLVSANIPVVYKGGWWLPRKAVWQSGNKSIVFKKQGDVFVPMQVETSVDAEGMVMVTTAIGDWQVAGNASYLVDSESFIKTTDQQKK
jgi:membrane fusion protein, copper/silver efflux system